MIPASNPGACYRRYRIEIDQAIQRVLDGGRYILGEEVRHFESEFAAYLGTAHAVGVGSGTEALHIAIKACGIGPNDEVITVSHTAVATVAAIEMAGATPVVVDIDPTRYTLDPSQLEAAITSKTRAIVPVHLYGLPADLTPIIDIAKRHQLRVIEDASQAHGARYGDRRVGAWGDLSCFSFYPTKNLGALGDGGAIVTSDASLAERARLLREYGWKERYVSELPGWNSRLDELQAAILRVKLRHLEEDNARRVQIAAQYDQALEGSGLLAPPKPRRCQAVYHQYVVRTPRRDALQAHLAAHGVQALIHYPVPVHLQPAYCGRVAQKDSLKHTEQVAREILSLPVHPDLDAQAIALVIKSLHDFRKKPHE